MSELLFFATQIEDWETLLSQFCQHKEWQKAVDTLLSLYTLDSSKKEAVFPGEMIDHSDKLKGKKLEEKRIESVIFFIFF
jgi:hypothetical protein